MTPLQVAREAKKMSCREVEAATGVDHSTVSRVERGLQMPDGTTADKLATYFGLSLEQVMFPERFKQVEEAPAG